MITIQELLYNRGLPPQAKAKLVRHKDARIDLLSLYRVDKKLFHKYQCSQKYDVFRGCEYVIAFLGEEDRMSRFVGVYRVAGRRKTDDVFVVDGLECGKYLYDMEEVSGFDDMKERTIIRWSNPRSWHQWITNDMEVQEISPGLSYRRFYDYTDIILSFPELRDIIENGYTDWKIALSSVKGIYLITDMSTGKLYVGAAYGEDGIWGRWKEYIATDGHGNNASLMELIKEHPMYATENFQFSILMLLSKTVTNEEAIRREAMFKRKLGANAFGLNNN